MLIVMFLYLTGDHLTGPKHLLAGYQIKNQKIWFKSAGDELQSPFESMNLLLAKGMYAPQASNTMLMLFS